jgi:hypothetical protein
MKNLIEYSVAQHRFPIRLVSFIFNSVCLLARVTVENKSKAVVCCFLATSAIMLPENKKKKRKMWSKKCYLKRNSSCDAHLQSELLETDVADEQTLNMLLTEVSPYIKKKEYTLEGGILTKTETYCYTEILSNRQKAYCT